MRFHIRPRFRAWRRLTGLGFGGKSNRVSLGDDGVGAKGLGFRV